jgi:hypothetical protein
MTMTLNYRWQSDPISTTVFFSTKSEYNKSRLKGTDHDETDFSSFTFQRQCQKNPLGRDAQWPNF